MDLVGVGVPVRNGARMIRDALDAVVRQTHANLDIVISDNASTDDTPAICKEYAARDRRIRYFRQERFLSAIDNYRACFEQTKAPWFLWVTDDDLRSDNYVETLLRGLQRNPRAALAFSDACIFENRVTREPLMTFGARELEPAIPEGAGVLRRQLEMTRSFGRGRFVQHYGLFRSQLIATYDWGTWDLTPLLYHLAGSGDFCHEPGAMFYHYIAENHLSAGRVLWRDMTWRVYEGLGWNAARAAAAAHAPNLTPVARLPLRLALFTCISAELHGGPSAWASWYATHAYQALPDDVKRWWRAAKRQVAAGRSH